jgi:hypothetical protein
VVPGAGALTVAPSDATAAAAWGQGGGGPANPQELNRYTYAGNNPVSYTDSSGHHPCLAAFAAGPAAPAAVGGCVLFFAGVFAVGYFTGQAVKAAVENSSDANFADPSSDIGGQTASPNPDQDPSDDTQDASQRVKPVRAKDWKDAERIVGERLGLTKNTQKFPVEGKAYQVQPDFVNLRSGGVVAEVKFHSGEISLTNQMRGEIALAQKHGVRYELYVRQGTVIEKSLQRLIDDKVVHLIRLFE